MFPAMRTISVSPMPPRFAKKCETDLFGEQIVLAGGLADARGSRLRAGIAIQRLTRRACNVRYPDQDRSVQTRGDRRGQARAPACQPRSPGEGSASAAQLRSVGPRKAGPWRVCADCRSEEGFAIQGPDPRRLRSADTCHGL